MARTLKYVRGYLIGNTTGGVGSVSLTIYTVPAGKWAEIFIAQLYATSNDAGGSQLIIANPDGRKLLDLGPRIDDSYFVLWYPFDGPLNPPTDTFGSVLNPYTRTYRDVISSGSSFMPLHRRSFYVPEGGTVTLTAYTNASNVPTEIEVDLFIVEEDIA